MAFGIPNSDPATGEFLSRIQYDTRVGFWKIVRRTQAPDGAWSDNESEPFKNPTMLVDFGSLEIGFIKFASPPVFMLVPFGSAIPVQPEEMQTNAQGRQSKAFNPGFRVKVYAPKAFGDKLAYYFAHNSKTVLGAMDAVHQLYLADPEAKTGKVPLIGCTGTTKNEVTTKFGTNTFYAPVFAIQGWHERPEVFGARTVAPPNGGRIEHVPNAAQAKASEPVKTAEPAMASTNAALDDDLPF